MSAVGASAFVAAAQALLVVFLLSLISTLSLRGASRAFGRMCERSPGRAMKVARVATTVGYAISVAGAVLSGGLMLALVLVL